MNQNFKIYKNVISYTHSLLDYIVCGKDLKDKTMAYKFMYIINDDFQNLLQLVVEMFGHYT